MAVKDQNKNKINKRNKLLKRDQRMDWELDIDAAFVSLYEQISEDDQDGSTEVNMDSLEKIESETFDDIMDKSPSKNHLTDGNKSTRHGEEDRHGNEKANTSKISLKSTNMRSNRRITISENLNMSHIDCKTGEKDHSRKKCRL